MAIEFAKAILSNATRSTLFGKFYERIIRKWLDVKLGFTVFEGKPRVYWKEQPTPNIYGISVRLKDLVKALENVKKLKSWCTPDGMAEKEGKYFIWEAKNWAQWYEPIERVLWSSPWLLAKKVDYRGKKYDLSGILFFWWSKPENESEVLTEIRQCLEPLSFQIYYISQILNQCITEKPKWYIDIIREVRSDIDKFFSQLLGQD